VRGFVAEKLVPHPDINRPKTTATDGNTPQQKNGPSRRETTRTPHNHRNQQFYPKVRNPTNVKFTKE
jgi:hypothetical protein